ncbi:NTP transferase domain-containing protein [Azospirillum sp. B21]|uniref:NTP transferase domain-containing protein n=1 Tax=Azospirillum sp. B21 TaxID=2607496 RepID=UPI0011F01C5A|nr:NTP transferase domain-containing protein [Azospirillum sp. B21]KAA0577958.1 NTP transferase domain-containing protein [Azospirillum sp. B21]
MSGYTILLPAAGRSSRYPNMRPKWMLSTPEGALMLRRALDSLESVARSRVVVGILREHEERYAATAGIRRALGEGVEIVVFDEVTRGPAETAYEMIRRAGVEGPVIIKDSDSWFSLPAAPEGSNFVCIADLRRNPGVTNVAGKSFVSLNEQGIVVNIWEKSVESNFISVGGYVWNSARQYCDIFDALMRNDRNSEIFISHLISQAVLDGSLFLGVEVEGLVDAGTLREWTDLQRRMRTFFLDFDGVVVKNKGQYFPPYWTDPDEPIAENVESLRRLQAEGAQFVFVTARPEELRAKVEAVLREAGLSWHALVMGCHHGPRVLVNDFAPSNPYPSAEAVNIPRNVGRLSDFIAGA